MIIGYARTSTVEQVAGLEAQVRDLKAAGVEKVFAEHISAIDARRPQLAAALDFVREGDAFVVTRIDRLARSVADLLGVVDRHLRLLRHARTRAADTSTVATARSGTCRVIPYF